MGSVVGMGKGRFELSRHRAAGPCVAFLLCLTMLPQSSLAQRSSSPQKDGANTSHRLDRARALREAGQLGEARKLYESLLPVLRAEADYADLGRALSALSDIFSAQGQYDPAMAKAREAAETYRKSGDHGGEARAVNQVGLAELYRGDYPAAAVHFEQALALYRRHGNLEGEIEQLNNIGIVSYFQGKYLEALRIYQSAMDHVEQTADQPWNDRRRQITVSNLATLFQRLGRLDRALELYRQLRRAPRALSPSEEARLLVNLGALYRRLEDPVKALETYREAQELFAREQHADGQMGVLLNIGIVLALDLGNLVGALEAFTRVLALAQQTSDRRRAMHAHLYRGESLLRLGQPGPAQQDFEAALSTAKELRTTEEEWKALYGLGRTAQRTSNPDLAIDYFRQAIARIESIRSGLRLSTLRAEFLGDKRDAYDALIELVLRQPDASELFSLMERSRARTFQDRLRESAGQANSAPEQTPTLSSVQSLLDDFTLLLEFWVTPRIAAVVWVTRAEFGILRKSFSPAELSEISSFLRDLPSGSGDDWRTYSESLGKLLLSGIEPLARPNLHHLLIVPDGILHSVPFELLRTGAGGSALLIERFDVSYLPSAALLLRDASTDGGSWRFPWTRELVAFGDPIVSSVPNSRLSQALPGDELQGRLPESAEEVQAIARMLQGRAEVYLGAADVKKHLLLGRAKGVSLVHLSTHATSDPDNPERSRILFSPENPGEPADYLFLQQIHDLDLRGVDLVTLSACDTERGKMIRGEGVQGFSRGLLSAGSRAAVTTLWRVADQPTAEFMKQFYYALGQRNSKAQALRLAKLKFLRSGGAFEHPRNWAAFVLNGDGLHPVTQFISWSTLLLPLAGTLLLLGVAARRWGSRADVASSGRKSVL